MGKYNYNKTNWIGGKTVGTADVMNNLEEGVYQAHEKLGEVDSQLEHNISEINNLKNKQFVTPEDFEGTDFEKLQQSLDFAILNKIDLCINKTYSISDDLIINKGNDIRYKTRIFGGGKIIRSGTGSIFVGNNKSISDIFITDITFESDINSNVTCFNCGDGYLIRLNIDKCYFDNLDYVFYTDSYLQSIRVTNSTFVRIKKSVIECGGLFDVKFFNIIYELSSAQFLNHTKKGEHNTINSFTLRDSVLEGITSSKNLIHVSNPYSFVVDNCYFEGNNCKNIVFYNCYECVAVKISNNIHLGTSDENQAFVNWSGILHDCATVCNSVSGIKINDTTNITEGRVISSGDFCSLTEKNIVKHSYNVITSHKMQLSDNIEKIGDNCYKLSISKTGVIAETKVCSIMSPINAGFVLNISGGGLQGDVGSFSLNCNYKVYKYNNSYTISSIQGSSFGSDNQHNNIICKVDGDKISVFLKSSNSLPSNYYLIIEVIGQVSNAVTY